MATLRAPALLLALLTLFALLLAGCSGGFRADDNDDGDDGDAEGGVSFDEDEGEEDAPGAEFWATVGSVALAAVALRRRRA